MTPNSIVLRVARLFIFLAGLAGAAAEAAPVRMAVLTSPTCRAEGDLLLAQLTGQAGVELLERAAMGKLTDELTFSALMSDPGKGLKAAGLMGADTLVFLDRTVGGGGTNLLMRVSSASLGAVIHASHTPLPFPGGVGRWATDTAARLADLAGKSTAPRETLRPLSVLNLRHIASGPAEIRMERELTTRLEEALARLPLAVVLERRSLGILEMERLLRWDKEQGHFWTCGHVLDGSISSAPGGAVTLALQVIPPGSSTPAEVPVAGAAGDLAGLAAKAAGAVMHAIAHETGGDCWNAEAEGKRFQQEAESALRINLFAEAWMAAEVAGILGANSTSLEIMRIQAGAISGLDWAVADQAWQAAMRARIPAATFDLTPFLHEERMLRALELAEARVQRLSAAGKSVFKDWNDWAPELTEIGGRVLHLLHLTRRTPDLLESENRIRAALATLNRAILKNTRDYLDRNPDDVEHTFTSWRTSASHYAPYWTGTPEETKAFYLDVMRIRCSAQGMGMPDSMAMDFRPPLVNIPRTAGRPRPPDVKLPSGMIPLFLDRATGSPELVFTIRYWEELWASGEPALQALWCEHQATVGDYIEYARSARDMGSKFRAEARKQSEEFDRNLKRAATAAKPPTAPAPVLPSTATRSSERHTAVVTPALAWSSPTSLLKNPGDEARVLDLKSEGENTYLMVWVLEKGRWNAGSSHLFQLNSEGRQTGQWPLPVTQRPANPPVCQGRDPGLPLRWSVQEPVAACLEGDALLLLDMPSGKWKTVPVPAGAATVTLKGPWAYVAFQGARAGILRVKLADGTGTPLCDTARSPRQTPFDQRSPFWIGPAVVNKGDSISFLGRWTEGSDQAQWATWEESKESWSDKLESASSEPAAFFEETAWRFCPAGLLRFNPCNIGHIVRLNRGANRDVWQDWSVGGAKASKENLRELAWQRDGFAPGDASLGGSGDLMLLSAADPAQPGRTARLYHAPPGQKTFTRYDLTVPAGHGPPMHMRAGKNNIWLYGGSSGPAGATAVWRTTRKQLEETPKGKPPAGEPPPSSGRLAPGTIPPKEIPPQPGAPLKPTLVWDMAVACVRAPTHLLATDWQPWGDQLALLTMESPDGWETKSVLRFFRVDARGKPSGDWRLDPALRYPEGGTMKERPDSLAGRWAVRGDRLGLVEGRNLLLLDSRSGVWSSLPLPVAGSQLAFDETSAFVVFTGEQSGVLRVNLADGKSEFLSNSRRKPAVSPYDDRAPFPIGPVWLDDDRNVSILGVWKSAYYQWATWDRSAGKWTGRETATNHREFNTGSTPVRWRATPEGFLGLASNNLGDIRLFRRDGSVEVFQSWRATMRLPAVKTPLTGLDWQGHTPGDACLGEPGELFVLYGQIWNKFLGPSRLYHSPAGQSVFRAHELVMPEGVSGPAKICVLGDSVWLFGLRGFMDTGDQRPRASLWRIPRADLR